MQVMAPAGLGESGEARMGSVKRGVGVDVAILVDGVYCIFESVGQI